MPENPPSTRSIDMSKIVTAQKQAETKMLDAQLNEDPGQQDYYRGIKVALESLFLGLFDKKEDS